MGLLSDFGAGIKLSGGHANQLADTDPFFGGIRGAVIGAASTGFNPYGIAAGAASGAIAGEQGKRQEAAGENLDSMLTAEAVKEQEQVDKATQLNDPRKRNTNTSKQNTSLLTSTAKTPSLLG